ncbi:DUF1799 domain-containing protein [Erwinia sp. 9145]|uniref:DUF1799 domain-containing protein n=1 Tax=Erwinia sp. 9145 TaxID=1500895 RepID=UPI000907AE9F|nr:DUF1799 domain-containing protein [Erwinia sp. 9145]
MAVASQFYTPEPTKEDYSAFGLSADDYTEEETTVDVWPDAWAAFNVFRSASTQWRVSMGGVTGLDYNVMPWLMKLYGIEDEATALNDIRVMERAALNVIHKGA